MKIIIGIVMTIVLMTGVSSACMKGEEGQKKDKMSMMKDMGMMAMMNKPSMVAVKDGIVILSGNKLTKYDNNLNLVKEVELKEKMACCKMMEKMKKDEIEDDEEVLAAQEQAATKKDANEHAGHH
jgi:hypothetical protein